MAQLFAEKREAELDSETEACAFANRLEARKADGMVLSFRERDHEDLFAADALSRGPTLDRFCS
jgi:hypothetical protein